MGYDVTLHPFKRREFKYFIEDVVSKPYLVDSRLHALHEKEEERAFLASAIYDRIPQFKSDVDQVVAHVEKTIGFASAAILGYLQPYWYLRNGLLSKLMSNPQFKVLSANLSTLVDGDNKLYFDSEGGIVENFSSGVYLPFENIEKFKELLNEPGFKKILIESIDEENIEPLSQCLEYCHKNQLDLLEATDLYVPFSGESSTYAPNMRALHLKNTSDHSNHSKKKSIEIDKGSPISNPVELSWWNNLNKVWKEAVRIAYQLKVTPSFEGNYSARNAHVDEKFNEATLDLAGLDELEDIMITLFSRDQEVSTLAPLFDFPRLKALDLHTRSAQAFDLRRVLQFPQLEKLELSRLNIDNFLAIKELEKLTFLEVGETNVKAAQLKKLKDFPSLKVLFIAFAPYRSVSFLQGNEKLEAVTLKYTKGLKNLPNLKRLYLFPNEAKPSIEDCPNIEMVYSYNAQRMTDISSFLHLEKLKSLYIRGSRKSVDLSQLEAIPSVENFYVDRYSKLETIPNPLDNIKMVYIQKDLDEAKRNLISEKFPQAKVENFVHKGYN